MKYAINIPNFGAFGDARLLGQLAHEAEQAGWDGFFLWDHIAWHPGAVDPWVALAVIALQTEHIRIGTLITPIPRRRPWKLAVETTSIDQLSSGRMTLGVGIGGGSRREWGDLGEETDLKTRGEMLDEGLDVLTRLWSGESFSYEGQHYPIQEAAFGIRTVQQPRIPIWIAGNWPHKAPMRRGARWEGICPQSAGQGLNEQMSPDALREAVAFARSQRQNPDAPFDVIHSGITPTDRIRGAEVVASYEGAGITWWSEIISPWVFGWDKTGEWPVQAMRERILAGPPKA